MRRSALSQFLLAATLLAIAAAVPARAQSSGPAAAAASAPAAAPRYDAEAILGGQDDGLLVATVLGTLSERVWTATGGRTDQPTLQEFEAYEAERAPDVLKLLNNMGVNLVVIPFGGYGSAESEAAERLRATEFAWQIRAAGMMVGFWLPVGQLHPDRPYPGLDVNEWLALDAGDQVVRLSDRGWCAASPFAPGYRQHVRDVVRSAVSAANPELVLLPDFMVRGGYERIGRKAYREFLTQRMKDPIWAGLLAIPNVGEITPPDRGVISRLTLQTWQEFRASQLPALITDVRDEVRAAGGTSRIGVETPIERYQPPVTSGPCYDLAQLVGPVSLFWDDLSVTVDSQGRIRHHIGSIKAVSDAGRRVVSPARRALDMAQLMAFGRDTAGCITYFHNGITAADRSGRLMVDEDTAQLGRFFRRRRELFRGMNRAVDVVLRRPDAFDFGQTPMEATTYLRAESALSTHRMPFTVKLGDSIGPLDPGQVIMLAGCSRLTDRQVQDIERHVRGGGGLVMIGPAGTRDEYDRARDKSLYERLHDAKTASPDAAQAARLADIPCWRVDRGRVVALREVSPPWNVWLTNRKPRTTGGRNTPPHADQFFAAVQWAAGRPLAFECDLRGGGMVELNYADDGRRAVLHEVNFDPRRVEESAAVTLRLPDGRRIKSVRRISPLTGTEETVTFKQAGTSAEFTLAACKLYEIYDIEFGGG